MRRELARFLRDNAATDLDAAVEMDEETRQKLMALGYLGGASGAEEKIEEVLRGDGVPPQDRVGDISGLSMVKHLIFSNRPLPARELAGSLLTRHPENPTYLEMLATAELQLGRLGKALETVEKIRRLDAPGEATGRILMQLGTLYFYRGEHDRAESLLREGQSFEATALGHYLLANVYSARGRTEDERSALEAALEIDPTYAPARIDLAIRQAQRGEHEAAAADFRRAMSDQSYLPRAFYNYGAFLVESGEIEAAAPHFERAVELEPSYSAEAERHYRTLRTRAPASPETERARQRIEEAR